MGDFLYKYGGVEMELSIYDTLLLWIILSVCIIAFIIVKALTEDFSSLKEPTNKVFHREAYKDMQNGDTYKW